MQVPLLSSLLFSFLLKTTFAQFDLTACGVTKGCFLMPNGCSPITACTAAVSYRKIDDVWVELELTGNANSTLNNNYVALGFSQDQNMPNTPVTECSSMSGAAPSGKLSYNGDSHNNTRILDVSQGDMNTILTTSSGTEANGRIYCLLRQMIAPPISSVKIVNLNQTFFLLMSVGQTSAGSLTYHYARAPSDLKVSPLSTQSANNPINGAQKHQLTFAVTGIISSAVMLLMFDWK